MAAGSPTRSWRLASASHSFGEAADVGEFGGVGAVVGEHGNAPPASMAPSWAQSPTSRTLAPASRACCDDGVEGEGAGEAGFVDDDELAGPDAPALVFGLDGIEFGRRGRRARTVAGCWSWRAIRSISAAMRSTRSRLRCCFVQPFGGVLGVDAELVGEHLGGGGGGREADDRAWPVRRLPTRPAGRRGRWFCRCRPVRRARRGRGRRWRSR